MIKQAIIPLAGLGTRLLPLTSVFPKELLPINGKPGIEYILDECIDAGIKEIIFIISNKKKMIKTYFYNDNFYSDIIPYCDQKCDTVKKVMLDDVLKLYCKCEYQVENRFENGAEAVSYFVSLRPKKEEIEVANNYYARIVNGGESGPCGNFCPPDFTCPYPTNLLMH